MMASQECAAFHMSPSWSCLLLTATAKPLQGGATRLEPTSRRGCSTATPKLPCQLTGLLARSTPGTPFFQSAERRKWYHINLDMDDIHVQPPSPQGPDADREWFLQQVKDAVTNSETKELVLYIHGYNNGFEAAVKTAAQLVVDTANLVTEGFYGPRAAVAFDWASCNATKHYATDVVRARAAGPKLAELLYHLGNTLKTPSNENPGPGPAAAPWCNGIHIICHSMGNYVLHQALLHRLPRTAEASAKMLIDVAVPLFESTKSVIFAAPDVSRHDMVRMLAELEVSTVPTTGGRLLILYCSKDDKPLWASSKLVWGADSSGRAGYYTANHKIHPFVYKDPDLVQTVDASGHFDDAMAHGYFSTNRQVLSDISQVLARGNRVGLTIRPKYSAELNCNVCRGRQFFCIR